MNRKLLSLSLAGVCAMAAWGLRAGAPDRPESKVPEPATIATADDLIVHEWGTFTTFSGSDGVHLDFRPLAAAYSDLPDFVRDRAFGHNSPFAKSRLRGKIRMETPVTYFYTDKERVVRASVDFPKGLLTEFYPPVRSFLPAFDQKAAATVGESLGNSRLDWGEIRLIPTSAFTPLVSNSEDAAWLQARILDTLCLPGQGHYTAARATDSAFVQTAVPQRSLWGDGPSPGLERHLEKFLFYRGVGKFDLPVAAVASPDGRVTMHNRGADDLRSVFLVHVDPSAGWPPVVKFSRIEKICGGQQVLLPEPVAVTEAEQLHQAVVSAIVAEGLYEKEARAMVETWKDSWFREGGTRVFYMVPQKTTDEVLPLHIEPRPRETIRVLVARLEVMPVSEERRVIEIVQKNATERAKDREARAAQGQRPSDLPVPPELLSLGRLAEPALARVKAIATEERVRVEAETLLNRLQKEL